ncbi:Rieske (2Fe-2S) protein [Myxococcaceae bacterium JPH2]|nr:Rieske (2Fe-2S) protein [Myxococcaceae bacterium JPH2]
MSSESTQGRSRVFSTPANVALCTLDSLREPGARNLVLQIGEAFFHGFLVRRGDSVWGYVDRCPHAGLPLAQKLDDYLTPDGRLIACSWHGALFQPEDGLCVGGPCSGARLTPWPVQVVGGVVRTA